MMRLAQMVIASAMLAALLWPSELQSAERLFRWKFKTGDVWHVAFEQRTETITTGAGKPTGITIDSRMQMVWQVDAVNEGGAVLRQEINGLTLTMQSGDGKPIEYRSDAPNQAVGPAAEVALAVQPLIGVPFSVEITDRGEVGKVRLSEEAQAALEATALPLVKQIFSPEGIVRVLGEAAIEFPKEPVSPGDRWETRSQIDSPLGRIKQTHRYTWAGTEEIDGATADKISVNTTLELDPQQLKQQQPAARLKLLEQESSGVIWFGPEAGRILRNQSVQKLAIERPYRELNIRVETIVTSNVTIQPQ